MAYEIPDFTSLANQQAGLNQTQANSNTLANRANQTGPNGESLTWTQGPDGQWTQNVSLGAGQQGVNQGVLAGQQQRLGLASSGLSNLGDWGSTDITNGVSAMPDSGFGADQKTIDAWRALNEPGLQQAQDAERTRLAAMGITLGSDISNNSERNLSLARTDADNKAILAGTQEYGNVFNRGLQARQQGVNENLATSNLVNALRGQKVSEANSLTSGIGMYDPKFASYSSATTAPAADVYGAARDNWAAAQTQYGNALGAQNANAASSANRRAGNIALLSAGLSGMGGVGGLLGGIGSLFSGGNSPQMSLTDANNADNWFANNWGNWNTADAVGSSMNF